MTDAVETRSLRRTFPARAGRGGGEIVALGGVDLSIPSGSVRGLLGPNGAGKTTLCKILSTVLLPSSGTASVLGHDVRHETLAVKRSIGVVFGGDRGLYGRLTPRQNLQLWGALYDLHGRALSRRVDELLERVGLSGRARDRVDGFSRGMKQRLHLARGLISDPRVLILDEPTSGMDPVAVRDFRGLIGELTAEGRTLLLTTHDMAEAEAVCDEVTLIDNGVLLATDTPARLAARLSTLERVEADGVADDVLAGLSALSGVSKAHRETGGRVVVHTTTPAATSEVLALLVSAGVTALRTVRPSLEEVYLHVIGDRGMLVSP
ncbi:ABC transporter ATP-binding protein [Umezawaea tangerina]|uniref:ABC-2 type transport system ATP-binding protein n=1 Tax=Umezawaea tangerina TaxID=84725 RepID=A0A2T0T803_9PSEU|nr:ABC transporter ATP-binding protein [Umezawaea tangerina]PRY41795.1 ABC-2 type transport system ATP-binding protein [Umezawaea tangerina]